MSAAITGAAVWHCNHAVTNTAAAVANVQPIAVTVVESVANTHF